MLITHDFGLVAEICDKVAVMYAGIVIETGTLTHIFNSSRHPYTVGLFNSIPRLDISKKG
jgi:ABC-type dipeptide/oligopeptide/nickel transport system ATPase component